MPQHWSKMYKVLVLVYKVRHFTARSIRDQICLVFFVPNSVMCEILEQNN